MFAGERIAASGCALLATTETRETPSVMTYGHAASLNEGGEARFARATPHQSRFLSMGGDWHFAPKGRGQGWDCKYIQQIRIYSE